MRIRIDCGFWREIQDGEVKRLYDFEIDHLAGDENFKIRDRMLWVVSDWASEGVGRGFKASRKVSLR